jgi:hypothetical protein
MELPIYFTVMKYFILTHIFLSSISVHHEIHEEEL